MSRTPQRIRVLSVEEHPLFRDRIAALMANTDDMQLVADAANGREALEQFRAHRPDVELSLEIRVAERTRIARELHDTLLQSFHGLLLQFQTVWELLPARPAEAREILGHSIDRAAKAITEGRDAVQGLRTSAEETNDLVATIELLGEEIAADLATNQAASLRVGVQGAVRTLHPSVRDEVYRIAAEAMRNAFQHSQGTQFEVGLRYDEQQFSLRVRDNGNGIDANVLAEGGRKEHYGLRGMRERAELIGGNLNVRSGLDAGTEVELTIAALRAYTEAGAASSTKGGKP